jgi:hypothetical protein
VRTWYQISAVTALAGLLLNVFYDAAGYALIWPSHPPRFLDEVYRLTIPCVLNLWSFRYYRRSATETGRFRVFTPLNFLITLFTILPAIGFFILTSMLARH